MDQTISIIEMENEKVLQKDQRLQLIQDQLVRFNQLDFNMRIAISDKGDDIDAIIVGLNTLAEELGVKKII